MLSKRKKPGSRYAGLSHPLMRSAEYVGLSCRAKALLLECAFQYNGYNNGDLCLSMSILRKRGYKSNDQRCKAIQELVQKKFLIKTRQGTRSPPKPDLYAMAFLPIDECPGKNLDVQATKIPTGYWRMSKGGILRSED